MMDRDALLHLARGRERAAAEGRLSDPRVIPLDEALRLRRLASGWRALPLPELVVRCRALAMADATTRLPTDVYDAWLQMSAVVTACGG